MSTTNSPPEPAKKHRNLAHSVVDYVSGLMREGRIRPGDKVPSEAEIIRVLGVSRTVVREAVSHMQAAGLVETRQGVGTFALAPERSSMGLDPDSVNTMPEVLSVLELRITLETEAAGLAASRRTEGQLQQIRSALEAFLSRCAAGGETAAADHEFHLAIARASGNRYLCDVLDHLSSKLLPRARSRAGTVPREQPDMYPERVERVTREHEDILNAIVRQDPESARAAMRTHLSNSRERLRRAYERQQAATS